MNPELPWHIYLLRCGDDTFYCGITTDPEARLAAHQAGQGAKYTRGRGPLDLVYLESGYTRSEALRRERAIKAMDRAAKRRLIQTWLQAKGV